MHKIAIFLILVGILFGVIRGLFGDAIRLGVGAARGIAAAAAP